MFLLWVPVALLPFVSLFDFGDFCIDIQLTRRVWFLFLAFNLLGLHFCFSSSDLCASLGPIRSRHWSWRSLDLRFLLLFVLRLLDHVLRGTALTRFSLIPGDSTLLHSLAQSEAFDHVIGIIPLIVFGVQLFQQIRFLVSTFQLLLCLYTFALLQFLVYNLCTHFNQLFPKGLDVSDSSRVYRIVEQFLELNFECLQIFFDFFFF